jgi:enamine deaminase RidA (YjgF/YER057c/UK114 family)
MIRFLVAVLMFLTLGQAVAGSRQQAVVTLPDDESAQKLREQWGYADAVLSGDTAYLSGMIAVVKEGENTPAAAYERMFTLFGERLRKIGCTWDDVVEITSFHTDLATQMPFFLAVKRKYVQKPFPAWTAVGVTRLIADTGVTEMKLVARFCGPASAQK